MQNSGASQNPIFVTERPQQVIPAAAQRVMKGEVLSLLGKGLGCTLA